MLRIPHKLTSHFLPDAPLKPRILCQNAFALGSCLGLKSFVWGFCVCGLSMVLMRKIKIFEPEALIFYMKMSTQQHRINPTPPSADLSQCRCLKAGSRIMSFNNCYTFAICRFLIYLLFSDKNRCCHFVDFIFFELKFLHLKIQLLGKDRFESRVQ